MARTYKRDSRGRFAGGGGGGGGGSKGGAKGGGKAGGRKAAAKKATPKVKQDAASQVRRFDRASLPKMYERRAKATGGGFRDLKRMNQTAKTAANAQAYYFQNSRKVQAGSGKAAKAKAPAKPAKMSKAAPNKAKAAYKTATSKAREARMLAGGRTSTRGVKNAGLRTTVKAAQAAASKVRAMEKARGRTGRKRKG